MNRRLLILLPTALLLLAGSLWACSVPVFRYAFEHWAPDDYHLTVFHRGELSEADLALVARLQPIANDGSVAVNLEVRTVNLDAETDDAMTALWSEQADASLPWMVLRGPLRSGGPTTIWTGELSDSNCARLLNSPARDELRQRLLNAESVVWVFLESGDAAADDAAYEVVQTEIKRLEQTLELPEIEDVDLKDLSVEPQALQLRMSAMRVSRDDLAERVLVESLMRVEPDLLEEPYANQPMAFPVFGRGRVLYSLVGEGIVPGTIEEACRFLTGACQCTVKAQNPGVDLLLAVDWDHLITPALPYDAAEPTLVGLAGFAASADGESPLLSGAELALADDSDTADQDQDATAESVRESAAGATSSETAATANAASTSPEMAPSIGGRLLWVVGLLAMGVIVASLVLIPRSR